MLSLPKFFIFLLVPPRVYCSLDFWMLLKTHVLSFDSPIPQWHLGKGARDFQEIWPHGWILDDMRKVPKGIIIPWSLLHSLAGKVRNLVVIKGKRKRLPWTGNSQKLWTTIQLLSLRVNRHRRFVIVPESWLVSSAAHRPFPLPLISAWTSSCWKSMSIFWPQSTAEYLLSQDNLHKCADLDLCSLFTFKNAAAPPKNSRQSQQCLRSLFWSNLWKVALIQCKLFRPRLFYL